MSRTNEQNLEMATKIYAAFIESGPTYDGLVKLGEAVYAKLDIKSPKVPANVIGYLFRIAENLDKEYPLPESPKTEELSPATKEESKEAAPAEEPKEEKTEKTEEPENRKNRRRENSSEAQK